MTKGRAQEYERNEKANPTFFQISSLSLSLHCCLGEGGESEQGLPSGPTSPFRIAIVLFLSMVSRREREREKA